MCWTGKNIPQIAQEDIKVFKVVKEVVIGENKHSFMSLCYNKEYQLGETYESEIEIIDDVENNYLNNIIIEKGLHSYSLKCGIILDDDILIVTFMSECGSIMGTLYGGYIDVSLYKCIKLNCVIPKGATYYENRHGEIVSNELRVDSAENIN